METNKKSMLAVGLAVAMIALAGVGYAAATGYTATTVIGDNDVDSPKYITIAPNDGVFTGKFAGTFSFDTVTSASGVQFTYHGSDRTPEKVPTTNTFHWNATSEEYEFATVENQQSNGDHNAIEVGAVTVAVNFNNTDATEASVAISNVANTGSFNASVNPEVMAIVFTITVGTDAEEIYDFSAVDIDEGQSIILKAYLVYSSGYVDLEDANTNLAIAFSQDLQFVATVA